MKKILFVVIACLFYGKTKYEECQSNFLDIDFIDTLLEIPI